MSKSYLPKHAAAMIIYIPLVAYYIFAVVFRRGIRELGKDPNFKISEEVRVLAKYGPLFFTSWNFGLQIWFMFVAILDTLALLLNLPLRIQKFLSRTRSGMFSSLVVPATLLVFSIFWSLYLYDRSLIYPDAIDKVLPNWLNHTLHTLIVVPVLMEFMLPKEYNFVKFGHAVKLYSIYMATYGTIFFTIYLTQNIFLYPIFSRLTWPTRVLFVAFIYALGYFYIALGYLVQEFKRPDKKKKGKKLP